MKKFRAKLPLSVLSATLLLLSACQSFENSNQGSSPAKVGNADQPAFALDPYDTANQGGNVGQAYDKPADITLRQQQMDQCRPLVMRVGQVLSVQLQGYPSTGYLWQLDERPQNLQLLSAPKLESAKNLPKGLLGAPSLFDWRFKATAKGKGNITLIYQRPWEDNSQSSNRFNCAVDVR